MAQLIKWAILALFSALSSFLPSLIGRILGFLGLATVTMTGMKYVENLLVTQFKSQLVGLPSTVFNFLGILHIDDAFTMVLSAWAIRRLIDGWDSSGSKTSYTTKAPKSMP